MKTMISLVSAALVAILCMAAPAFCQTQVLNKSRDDEETQIQMLKKRLAEQDRRISQLEEQVKALLDSQEAAFAPALPDQKSSSATRLAPGSVAQSTPGAEPSRAKTEPEIQPAEVKDAEAPSSAQDSEVLQGQAKKAGVRALLSPIHFGGNVYLFQYVPVGVSGVSPKFELYAFSALADAQRGKWGFHADYRFRTTKLRSFFPGNTWLQQGYVRYQTPWGEARAGSFYRRVGIEWDDSFIGNIQYFDGLKLDPEFGVGFEGAHNLSGRLGAEYSLQYFSTDARVNGSLPGRDFVSEPGARAKNDVTMRFAPVWHFNKQTSLTLGGSFAQGTIDRDAGPHNTRTQVAADGTLQFGPLLTYGEVLRQSVNGVVVLPPQDATYVLGGVRWARGHYQPRFNFSQGNYHGLNGRREYIFQPGITVRVADNLSFIYEFNFWRSMSAADTTVLDRSLDFVLLYHF